MIEFVCYSLNLYDKSSTYRVYNDYYDNKKYFDGIKNFENFMIAEELVNEIYMKQNLANNNTLPLKAIIEYFSGKNFFD